jgi:sugar phosphate isomerase/epimerase
MFTTLAPRTLPLRVSFARQLELAGAHGFDALDLPLSHVLTDPVDVTAERFASAGLRCGGWQLPFDYQADPPRPAQMARLGRLAERAARLGSPWCYYWIEPASDELTYAANTALHVRRLRPIADVLGSYGCRLGLEPVGPETLRTSHRYAFVHSVPMALELLAAVDRPNVGLLLDCYHWYTSRGTVAELQDLTAAQIVYVHVNDAPARVDIADQLDDVRLLPGASGVIDLTGFLRALTAIGYDGPIAVEPFDAELAGIAPERRVALAARSLHAAFAAAGVVEPLPNRREGLVDSSSAEANGEAADRFRRATRARHRSPARR